MMNSRRKALFTAWCAVFAALIFSMAGAPLHPQSPGQSQFAPIAAAQSELNSVPKPEPSMYALPLPEDRGAAQLEQTLKQLGTTASMLYIVPHPDDEDGALLTYLTRGLGARVTLLTFTRGEGGQNAMSAEMYDAMGLIRTEELLKADEYYGVSQLWGTVVDFGFSKTQQESFAKWGHERMLYDTVLAIRKVRPQILISSFVGGVSDGHGQHQVAGEIMQEAFKAAGDPKVFPEQLKDGLEPWQPLAVYSREPFARITPKGIFDYATGKWAPARFKNYLTGEWINGPLSADVTIPLGTWDPVLGLTYVQIARTGWGEQKSQYGGASPALDEPDNGEYHLWAVAPAAAVNKGALTLNTSLFQNSKVNIDTSVDGLARLAGNAPPAWLTGALREIHTHIDSVAGDCRNQHGADGARKLAQAYRETLALYTKVGESDLSAQAKSDLEFELAAKIDEFQTALKDMLGLDLIAFRSNGGGGDSFHGGTADETPRAVTPGETFSVRVHTAQAYQAAHLGRVWLESHSGPEWKAQAEGNPPPGGTERAIDTIFQIAVPPAAAPTAPYFTRPNTEQPYYDIANQAWRERSFMPWPLDAWAEFTFDGLPIRLGGVVQTLQRVTGQGGFYEPLVVTPAIGVRVEPEARILPLDGSALPVRVTVETQQPSTGTVKLELPAGWTAQPEEAHFATTSAGDTAPLVFSVTTDNAGFAAYSIQAVAESGGRSYKTGWHNVSYPGLLPYNQYKPAVLKTRKVDVQVAPHLRVGYIMGTGDNVPEAIGQLGIAPHLIDAADLATADLSQYDTIVVGIRAYIAHPELAAAQPRLDQFVRNGGTLVVQYQSETFPAPLPLAMGRMPERVVEEDQPVKLLDPGNPLLTWPNKITEADFNGWLEERGHGFLDSWAPGYTALTETADPGQSPQRGGLLVAHVGKGTYIYVAYALYRQLPELVPGAYRILANLISAGHETGNR